jgi:hypothetical protein
MDERRFGELTKQVAHAETRRGVVRVLAGSLTASVLALAAGGRGVTATDVGDEVFGYCSPPQTPCSQDKKCCSGKCKNGACTCRKKGAPCINRAGIVCCSQKCRNGKCK